MKILLGATALTLALLSAGRADAAHPHLTAILTIHHEGYTIQSRIDDADTVRSCLGDVASAASFVHANLERQAKFLRHPMPHGREPEMTEVTIGVECFRNGRIVAAYESRTSFPIPHHHHNQFYKYREYNQIPHQHPGF